MAKFNMDKIKGLGGVPEQNENKGMVGAGLLNVASQAQAALQKATIFVPYDKIVRNPMNKMSRKNIDELAQLIELAGLQQPLVVKQTGDGKYMILTGERRYLAIGKLISEGKWNPENLVEVKLQDMDKLNVPLQEDTKELFEVVVTNQHRKKTDSDKYFEAMAWKKIIQEFRENGKQLRVVGYDENGEPIEQMRTIMTTGMDDDGNAIEEDITGMKTQQIIGDKLGVSAAFVGQMEKIENNGSEELKDALTEKVMNLLIEMGKGFAFVGREYPLPIEGTEEYIDLLFYHLNLHCYVVVEVKIKEFKSRDIGQIGTYINIVDDIVKMDSDGKTIGLIICKGKNNVLAKYAVNSSNEPIAISAYELSNFLPENLATLLPSTDELESRLLLDEAVNENDNNNQ